jgi:glycosyltransferase involved in cell wall biosynthesis
MFVSKGGLLKMKKILLLPKYPRMGASSRVRTFQFLPLWEAAGYQVRVSSFFNELYLKSLYAHVRPGVWNVLGCYLRRFWLLLSVWKYDVLIIEKELFPYVPAYAEFLLKVFGKKYIVDYDDAVFHNYDLSENWLIRNWMGSKIDQVMKRANQVWAGSEYLEKRAIEAGAGKVVRLATVVDSGKYFEEKGKREKGKGSGNEELRRTQREENVRGTPDSYRDSRGQVAGEEKGSDEWKMMSDVLGVRSDELGMRNEERVVVGWIGSPSTLKYLRSQKSLLEKLGKEIPFTLLVVNGSEDKGKREKVKGQESVKLGVKSDELGVKSKKKLGMQVKHIAWTEEGEVEGIRKMDIGIMPLPDDQWERGKCAYKLIQYMACGLPVVASPVGMNKEVVRHGENGFLATTEEEWIYTLKTLIQDAELRKRMGEKGLELVRERFTVEGNFGVMKKEVEKILRGG